MRDRTDPPERARDLETAADCLRRSAARLRAASRQLRQAALDQKRRAAAWAEAASRIRAAVEAMKRGGAKIAAEDGSMSPEKTRPAEPAAGSAREFTYADYLELRGWEFEKFRNMAPISDREAAETDWDRLAADLIQPFAAAGGAER